MSEEPAPYRAGPATFELHFGSALKAVLPGAFQGSVIGSILTAIYIMFLSGTGESSFSVAQLAGAVMTFCFVMLIGTMAGMIICSLFIIVIGLPLALLLRRRIATQGALILTVLVAIGVALSVGYVFLDPDSILSLHPRAMTALLLAYAVPTGIAYRQAIITERMLSFWSTDAD